MLYVDQTILAGCEQLVQDSRTNRYVDIKTLETPAPLIQVCVNRVIPSMIVNLIMFVLCCKLWRGETIRVELDIVEILDY